MKVWNPGMINDRPLKSVQCFCTPSRHQPNSYARRLVISSWVKLKRKRKKTRTDSCKKKDKRFSTSFDEHTSLNNCCYMCINLMKGILQLCLAGSMPAEKGVEQTLLFTDQSPIFVKAAHAFSAVGLFVTKMRSSRSDQTIDIPCSQQNYF